jgi:hypothetical protein
MIGPKMVCTKCGTMGVDVRPRESATVDSDPTGARGRRIAGRWKPKAKTAKCNFGLTMLRISAVVSSTQPLAILLEGLVEIFGFGLGENSQNVHQVARGAASCLCGSALHALAKSVSEFQESPFVARIAELRLRP